MWTDYLRLGEFVLLILGLGENVIVHQLIRRNLGEEAARLDRVARFVLPFCLYPLFVSAMVLLGLGYQLAAAGVIVFGCLALLLGSLIYMKCQRDMVERERRKLIKAVGPLDLATDDAAPLLEQVFDAFDDDKSGAIDARELNNVLRRLFPRLSRQQRIQTMSEMEMRDHALLKDDFVEALQNLYRKGTLTAQLSSIGKTSFKAASSPEALPKAASPDDDEDDESRAI